MRRLFTRINLCLLASTLLLNACGSGGGGGGGIKDTTPPVVSSSTPVDMATSVNPATTITATFNEDIFAATVDATSFTLSDSLGTFTGSVSFNATTNVATFTPSQPLALLHDYTATLTSAITDLSGNGLSSNYNWGFTTRDGAWQTAGIIDTDDTDNAVNPQTGIDASGNVIVIWSQRISTYFNIYARRYDAATATWATVDLVDSEDLGDATLPQIGIDSAGNAIAVWHQSDGIRNNIWANRYDVGTGTWGTAQTIESLSGETQYHQVAVDANGNAIAVWQTVSAGINNIWANRYDATTNNWGATAVLIQDNLTTSENAWYPQIAFDSTGNAIAVWQQLDSTPVNNIWANRYDAASGWGTAQQIETDTESEEKPQIAIDAAGNAIAVWEDHNSTTVITSIRANRYNAASATWGASSQEIDNSTTEDTYVPQIAVDAAGNAIVVWEQNLYNFPANPSHIYANHYNDTAGTWGSSSILLVSDTTNTAVSPQIAADAAGNALAVWQHDDGTRYNIQANRYDAATQTWSGAALIETDDTGAATIPQIVMNPSGYGMAVWQHNDGTRENIQANRFE